MVAFMLHDPRMKALDGAINSFSKLIEASISKAAKARYKPAQTRHGKAPLPTIFLFVTNEFNFRVDQDGLRDLLGIGIPGISADGKYHHTQRNTNLRRSKPRAVEISHGVPHVGYQFQQFRSTKGFDRLGDLKESGIAHAQHFADHWNFSATFASTRTTRSIASPCTA